MQEKHKWLAAVVGGVLVIGGIVYYGARGSGNNANAPAGTFWVCTNPSAKHEFRLTVAQVSDWHKAHYGEPVACPTCGKPAVRASKCPSCGTVSPWSAANSNCPRCQKPYPPEE